MNTVDIEQQSKKKLTKSKSIVSEIFSEYCSKTSIHGIGYLGAKDKGLPEKIWWLIVFLISIAACSYLITDTWLKWRDNPVILSFSQKQTPIWKVPFPAITICPFFKVNKTRYNYSVNYFKKNFNSKEKAMFWDISLICDLKVEKTDGTNNFTNRNAIRQIKKVSPNVTEVIKYIKWQNTEPTVKQFFKTQLTSEGVCFTFNSLNQKDIYTDQMKENVTFIKGNTIESTNWSIEGGYLNTNITSNYPISTSQDGSTSGLKVVLTSTDFERDFICGDAISGFKVTLHNPAETPRTNHKYFLVPLYKYVAVAVTPNVITASKGLYNIPTHTRNCFFQKEKKLRFFQTYTKNNCKTECFANISNSLCGCVPFYMPQDNNAIICGLAKTECIKSVQGKIITFEMMLQNSVLEYTEEVRTNEFQIFKNCDCLPACASIDYTSDTSDASYNWNESLIWKENKKSQTSKSYKLWRWITGSTNNNELQNQVQTSEINFFFKESEFIALHRKELYGRTEFLANCGGLLGLFMGFSFLSLLEIIYFVTIRLWIYLRKMNQSAIDVKS